MELWLRDDGITNHDLSRGIDRYWRNSVQNEQDICLKDGKLYDVNGLIGARIVIRDGQSQNEGIQYIGTADWLLVECETWSMIPLENLIAAREGSHTKIAAVITSPIQAQGAGFALQQGVDALVVNNDHELIEAALSVKSQRLETLSTSTLVVEDIGSETLAHLEVLRVEDAGLGDRYCLDFLSLLHQNEGVLVGSSSETLVLVHSETVPSTFVPTRPFRVNAGSPHAYILMADRTTKYLSELVAGDVVRAVNIEGQAREIVLGRIKIEQRPMLKISCMATNNDNRKNKEVHVFLQQAETVRLIDSKGAVKSVTELHAGDVVVGRHGLEARHLGVAISSAVEER
jgi:3-dehydroquinate synthase II